MATPTRSYGEAGGDFNATVWGWPFDPGLVDPTNNVFVVVAVEGDVSGSINTTSFPGWVKIGRAVSGGLVTCELYAKIDMSGDETLVEINFGAQVRGSSAYVVCDGGGGITATFLAGSGSNADPPSHTSYANGDHLWWTAVALDGIVDPSAAPSSWTQDGEAVANVNSASLSLARRALTGSSIDPGAWTHSSTAWVAVTFGLGDVALGTPALPTAPTNLVAVAQGATAIALSWTDNASNETGYQIWRAPHVP